jgi:hypothetical protein
MNVVDETTKAITKIDSRRLPCEPKAEFLVFTHRHVSKLFSPPGAMQYVGGLFSWACAIMAPYLSITP